MAEAKALRNHLLAAKCRHAFTTTLKRARKQARASLIVQFFKLIFMCPAWRACGAESESENDLAKGAILIPMSRPCESC